MKAAPGCQEDLVYDDPENLRLGTAVCFVIHRDLRVERLEMPAEGDPLAPEKRWRPGDPPLRTTDR
jgi:hypothetical protein